MTNRSKLTSALAVVLIIALGTVIYLTMFKRTDSGDKLKTVCVGSFSVAIDYAPYLIAKEKKWFEEALKEDGITVDYTKFETLPSINESFATGRVDIVFEAEPPAIIGRAAGIDLRIVAMSCSLTQELIVPAASPVKAIADLKGKRVAVLAGTSSHYGLFKGLETHGLSRKDFAVVDMRPPDAKGAFRTGAIDAWAVWPPWVEQELVEKAGRVLPGMDAQIYSIMAVRGEFADKNPKVLSKLVRTLEKAKEWIMKNPQEAQKVVSKALDLPLEVVQLAWPKHVWDARITPAVSADIQGKADFLRSEGFIKSAVDVQRDLIRVPAGSSQSSHIGFRQAPVGWSPCLAPVYGLRKAA